MSKETLLKGFRSEFSEYLRPKTIGVFDSILLANEFEEYLTKAIDQTKKETREETIKECIKKVNEACKTNDDLGDYGNGFEKAIDLILNKLKN